jgi:hypothetical protein
MNGTMLTLHEERRYWRARAANLEVRADMAVRILAAIEAEIAAREIECAAAGCEAHDERLHEGRVS